MSPPLGEFIRRQRELQELSMRQLADLVGISNPYLSQIERGLWEPSDKVLEAIAENLQLSAEAVSQHAGRHSEVADEPAVLAAIRADPKLTARERQALVEIYTAFVERRRRAATVVPGAAWLGSWSGRHRDAPVPGRRPAGRGCPRRAHRRPRLGLRKASARSADVRASSSARATAAAAL